MNVLKIQASIKNLSEVLDFIDGFLEDNDCSIKTQTQIDLSAEEIFVNIANYAYGDCIGNAEIKIGANDGIVTLIFSDGGVPYNPLEKADPDITLSAEEREVGGLGIFLVKKNMDTVSYEYKDNCNILTMTKRIK